MKKRLFFAILFNENFKKQLAFYQKEIKKMDRKDYLRDASEPHLTVLFLGYIEEKEIDKIIEIAQKISQQFKPFLINFQKIEYGPRPPYRLIWLKGKENKSLEDLKNELENKLTQESIKFQKEARKIIPHITLFRIKKNFNLPSPHLIEKEVNLSFLVESFCLMESILKPEGAHYLKIKEFSFKK